MNTEGSASMLDDKNVIKQRDPSGALSAVMSLTKQAEFSPEFNNFKAGKNVESIVLAGMGGSALAADMISVLLADRIKIPLEVVKGYSLPKHARENTLVITISHSGNTEETLSCYDQARQAGCVMVAMATGGELVERAERDDVPYVVVPNEAQPRMSTVYHIVSLLHILQHYGIETADLGEEIASSSSWLSEQLAGWGPDVATNYNYAKQLAQFAVGKTAVFYGGELTWPMAYKWKISWNETAQNLAFSNQYPEFSHNEFMSWTSHPVEKPYAVFDIRSSFERPRVLERMDLTDRMLSGMRPKAKPIDLSGDSLVRQFLWSLALADMTSIYLAVLNNVDPTPVELIEKFKKELS